RHYGMSFLRDHGVYRFSISMRTPFAGQRVIARSAGSGFDLFILEEWGALMPARLRVNAEGRLLYHGRPTGYREDVLVDSGETVDR
ncbi:MAG: hypothetical protein ACKVVP_04340, partial [Chloroflexota bacterium]